MTLPPRVLCASQQMRQHLDAFDWSGLTPGRRNILEAFLRLAARQGYAAVTMRALGKEIHLKAPSIYSHFPGGRDEIVAESLRWDYYRFGLAALEAVADCKDGSEFFDAMVRIQLTHQLDRPESDLWDIVVASDRIGGDFCNATYARKWTTGCGSARGCMRQPPRKWDMTMLKPRCESL